MFLKEKDFRFLESLKEKFFRKARNFWKREKDAPKRSTRRPVERRSKGEEGFRTLGFSGERSSVIDEAKWSRFWSWRRVLAREWEMNYEERYEQMVKQIKI